MIGELVYNILKFIGDLNYWHVALLTALESTAFPVVIPVETIVIPMGYYAYLGTKSLPLLMFSCTTGIVIGCLVNYAFARFVGRAFIYKHAKFLHLNVEKLQKLEGKFLSHGRLLMFVGRFVPIPAFKHIITIPAGMAKMPIGQFIFYNALGGFIFSTAMLLIGYFFGSSEELWRQALGKFVFVCLALFGIYLIIRFVISALIKKSERNNEGTAVEDISDKKPYDSEEDSVAKDERADIFLGNHRISNGHFEDSDSAKHKHIKKELADGGHSTKTNNDNKKKYKDSLSKSKRVEKSIYKNKAKFDKGKKRHNSTRLKKVKRS